MKRLERAQPKTVAQRDRYRGYGGAGQVSQEFEDDLTFQAANRTNADLKRLGLPLQADVSEFFRPPGRTSRIRRTLRKIKVGRKPKGKAGTHAPVGEKATEPQSIRQWAC
jgi:hypothetical protein